MKMADLYADDKFLVISDDDQPDSPSDIYGPWLGVGVFIGFIVLSAFIVVGIMYISRAQERRKRSVKESKQLSERASLRSSIVLKPYSPNDTSRTVYTAGDTFSDNSSERGSVDVDAENTSSNSTFDVESGGTDSHSSVQCKDDSVCAICNQEYLPGEPVATSVNTKCKHHFHLTCIEKWLEYQHYCPVCNEAFVLQTSSS